MTLNKYSEGDTPVYTVHSFEFHRHLENSAANISKDIGQLTCFIELALSNSMKLSHARRSTQDGRVMVETSDRMCSTGEGNGKPLQYSCLENPMNSMKRQNDMTLKEELPQSVGTQYATADQWRNNSRKNEGMGPKQKQYPIAFVTVW